MLNFHVKYLQASYFIGIIYNILFFLGRINWNRRFLVNPIFNWVLTTQFYILHFLYRRISVDGIDELKRRWGKKMKDSDPLTSNRFLTPFSNANQMNCESAVLKIARVGESTNVVRCTSGAAKDLTMEVAHSPNG